MTGEELWNAPFTQEHMQRALDYALDATKRSLATTFESNILRRNMLESPLEAAFVAWWSAVSHERQYEVDLHAQREVVIDGRTVRLDFVIEPAWTDRELFARAEQRQLVVPKIGVELDGHDFHERTKAQVTVRDSRDRLLSGSGWKVLHFSGSEFNRDPVACVDGAYSAASSAFWDLKHRFWASERDFPGPDTR